MMSKRYGKLKDSSDNGDDVMKAGASFIRRTSNVDAPTELSLGGNEKYCAEKQGEANNGETNEDKEYCHKSEAITESDKASGAPTVKADPGDRKRKTSKTLYTRRNAIWEESSSEREGLKKLLDYYVLLQNLQDFNMGTFTFPYCLE